MIYFFGPTVLYNIIIINLLYIFLFFIFNLGKSLCKKYIYAFDMNI